MKAIDTELTKFFRGRGSILCSYLSAKKYSWKKDNCLKLIDDILKVAKR